MYKRFYNTEQDTLRTEYEQLATMVKNNSYDHIKLFAQVNDHLRCSDDLLGALKMQDRDDKEYMLAACLSCLSMERDDEIKVNNREAACRPTVLTGIDAVVRAANIEWNETHETFKKTGVVLPLGRGGA